MPKRSESAPYWVKVMLRPHASLPTSRGVITDRATYFIVVPEGEVNAIGECGPLAGLSPDDRPDFVERLEWTLRHLDWDQPRLREELREFPAIQFGVEQVHLARKNRSTVLFATPFTAGERGIRINGLIWMGSVARLREQLREKALQGFTCVKLKIGADIAVELDVLREFRREFPAIEIRLDANGAFSDTDADDVLRKLATLNIHSIEQPLRKGAGATLRRLCETSPIPIALDEELIGVVDFDEKAALLDTIKPHYLVLKPTLLGGYAGAREWIDLASERRIGWWVTSLLESNVGLSAIAQWTSTLNSSLPQGLGTGALYTNNIPSPLFVEGEMLRYDPGRSWNMKSIVET